MDRNKLVKVFDDNALLYHKYRPRYPKELIEDLIDLSQIQPADRLLEIGCGTGQITQDFVKRGYDVIAIEKGAALARIAAQNIEPFGTGTIINSTFEEWQSEDTFKLMLSAQAFHWIDKEMGITKVLNRLEQGASIGLIWNMDQSQETEFWKETNEVYEKNLPKKQGQNSMEDMIQEYWTYIKSRTELAGFERKEYAWEKLYSKEDYLGLLRTFSPHMSLEERKRNQFFSAIEAIIARHDNQVKRYYTTVLLFARKQNGVN